MQHPKFRSPSTSYSDIESAKYTSHLLTFLVAEYHLHIVDEVRIHGRLLHVPYHHASLLHKVSIMMIPAQCSHTYAVIVSVEATYGSGKMWIIAVILSNFINTYNINITHVLSAWSCKCNKLYSTIYIWPINAITYNQI